MALLFLSFFLSFHFFLSSQISLSLCYKDENVWIRDRTKVQDFCYLPCFIHE